jgi:hypothetical protein
MSVAPPENTRGDQTRATDRSLTPSLLHRDEQRARRSSALLSTNPGLTRPLLVAGHVL